jgi:2'-5' RNA ligase
VTQSIDLLLDDATEAAIRAQWDALKQASLPSMARHTGETNRPHVTLAIASQIPATVEASLKDLAAHVPLAMKLGAITLFVQAPARVILVRLVIPSAELLAVHTESATRLDGLPGRGTYHQPGHWTPHVTLANDLPADKVAVALAVLGELPDLEGAAVAVRRWDSIAKRTWNLT